jgi:hypothetical protein
MDIKIVDKLKEIVRDEAEFALYNQQLLDYCYPDEDVVYIVQDGVRHKWIRIYANGEFVPALERTKLLKK